MIRLMARLGILTLENDRERVQFRRHHTCHNGGILFHELLRSGFVRGFEDRDARCRSTAVLSFAVHEDRPLKSLPLSTINHQLRLCVLGGVCANFDSFAPAHSPLACSGLTIYPAASLRAVFFD
jgi:hypothetical protein